MSKVKGITTENGQITIGINKYNHNFAQITIVTNAAHYFGSQGSHHTPPSNIAAGLYINEFEQFVKLCNEMLDIMRLTNEVEELRDQLYQARKSDDTESITKLEARIAQLEIAIKSHER